MTVTARTLQDGRVLYEGAAQKQGEPIKYFAMVVERNVPCDLCHDIRFIYVIDDRGVVAAFHPVQVYKLDNEPWDEEDILMFSGRIVGRKLSEPWPYDPRVDAVSSATISSSVIFDALSRDRDLPDRLTDEGIM